MCQFAATMKEAKHDIKQEAAESLLVALLPSGLSAIAAANNIMHAKLDVWAPDSPAAKAAAAIIASCTGAVDEHIARVGAVVVTAVKEEVQGLINLVERSSKMSVIYTRISKSNIEDKALQKELLATTLEADSISIHKAWQNFRKVRKLFKSVKKTLPEGSLPKLTTAVGEVDRLMDSDGFKNVLKAMGCIVAVQAAFRDLNPGESRCGVTEKAAKGTQAESMPVPEALLALLSSPAAPPTVCVT